MKNIIKNNEIVKLALILFAITSVVALSLGSVNALTKDKISANKDTALAAALEQIIPNSKFKEIPIEQENGILAVYGSDDGYCIKVLSDGFGGPIEIVVGISNDEKILDIVITNQTETPGLGTKAAEPEYTNLFKGKSSPLKSVIGDTQQDNEISAITGATVTSDAVVLGVEKALDFFINMDKGE